MSTYILSKRTYLTIRETTARTTSASSLEMRTTHDRIQLKKQEERHELYDLGIKFGEQSKEDIKQA
jgi:hypothetical protein